MRLHALTSLLLLIYVSSLTGSLLDLLKRKRRDQDDASLADAYWREPVSLGVFVNEAAVGDSDDKASKRTDTPFHGSGSGSGGGFMFSDSAKRDSVPKPSKIELEKESELNAKASNADEKSENRSDIDVQGEESKRKTTVTCQGQKEWLQCPIYRLIKINSAFWGRDDENPCSHSAVTRGLKTSKMCAQDESNTMAKVQNACDGESACELVASPVYFDRTDCPDIYKFLRVSYDCVHSESRVKEERK